MTRHRLREIASGDALKRVSECSQWASDPAPDQQVQARTQRHGGQREQQQERGQREPLRAHGFPLRQLGHHHIAGGFTAARHGEPVMRAGSEHRREVVDLGSRRACLSHRRQHAAPCAGDLAQLASAQCRGKQHDGLIGVATRIEHIDAARIEEARLRDELVQRSVEVAEVERDEQGADDLALQVPRRLKPGDERLAEQHIATQIGLSVAQGRVGGVARLDRHAHRALALGVLQRGADHHEVRPLLHQHGSGSAGEVGELVAGVVVFDQRNAQLHQLAVGFVERERTSELVAEHLEEALDQHLGGLVIRVERLRDGLYLGVRPGHGSLLRPLAQHHRHDGADARDDRE